MEVLLFFQSADNLYRTIVGGNKRISSIKRRKKDVVERSKTNRTWMSNVEAECQSGATDTVTKDVRRLLI